MVAVNSAAETRAISATTVKAMVLSRACHAGSRRCNMPMHKGVTSSTPMVSPAYQFHSAKPEVSSGMIPVSARLAMPTAAATQQASGPPRTSRPSASRSVSSCRHFCLDQR